MKILNTIYTSVINVIKANPRFSDIWKFMSIFVFSFHLTLNCLTIVILLKKLFFNTIIGKINFLIDFGYWNDMLLIVIFIFLPILVVSITKFKSCKDKAFNKSNKESTKIFIIYMIITYLFFYSEVVFFW